MNVVIDVRDSTISVESPYNADFVKAARDMGGRWDGSSSSWLFDRRDEADVKALCMKIYGTDGDMSDVVTIKVTFPEGYEEYTEPIALSGRLIARAFGRDSGARLGEGVRLVSGGFNSGGSVKNWKTVANEGTATLVRDFSRAAAEELAESPPSGMLIEIIDESGPDKGALKAERARLMARIGEIDRLLGE